MNYSNNDCRIKPAKIGGMTVIPHGVSVVEFVERERIADTIAMNLSLIRDDFRYREPAKHRCEYCSSTVTGERCDSCGAPVKMKFLKTYPDKDFVPCEIAFPKP